MKTLRLFLLLSLFVTLTGCRHSYEQIVIEKDTISLLRNPCMGWGVYDDANNEVQDADVYWKAQDEAARKYGSFFYVRWRWSDLEPEEGRYAWLYNENYKKLIKGALDRGLKLCFRVYYNGQDNLRSSTPDYVRKAGAKGYTVKGIHGDLWTPYPDDSVFQTKLEAFIRAFAKEYDNPDKVDFIDGNNLGWWGECHNIVLQRKENLEQVFDWITSLYSSCFKHVLLVFPFNSQFGFEMENRVAIERKGYGMRRDGLGSMWFTDEEREMAKGKYGKVLLVGESCYWGSSDDVTQPFASDKKYKMNSWREVYEHTFSDAMDAHFNTLDLREIPETKGWTEKAADLVQAFVAKGGYRLYPTTLSLPCAANKNSVVSISHVWTNIGSGYLPNNMPNWNYKYKPAFALLDSEENVVQLWIDENAEPSEWLQNENHSYSFSFDLSDVPAGRYKWAVAIVDRNKNNRPGIQLAIANRLERHGWYILNDFIVE